MGASRLPYPIFRADRFELSGRQAMMETLLPNHHNRMPTEAQRDRALWAVEGLLIPGREDTRRLLAVNIGDVDIPDPAKPGEMKTVEGDEIAGMLASARLGRITEEFPNLKGLEGHEVRIMLPQEAKQSKYAEGLEVMKTTFASLGNTANGGAEVIPVPIAA